MSTGGDLEVRPGLVITADELRESSSRASGPGGQHVNKSSTRVSLRWNVAGSACLSERQRRRLLEQLSGRITRTGDLVVHSDRTRSQWRNRRYARERLARIVREALVVAPARRATRPSRAERARRLDSKTQRGALKRSRAPVDPTREDGH